MNVDVQKALIRELNARNANKHLGSLLSRLLGSSKSVVYKKLRCEAPFSLAEFIQIAVHFNISIDRIMGREHATGLQIEMMPLVKSFDTLTQFLTNAYTQLSIFHRLENFEMIYAARDMPLFHFFKYPELGALKALAWVFDSYKKRLKLKDVPNDVLVAGKKMYDLYLRLNCTEIWNDQTPQITLKQILYYHQIKMLSMSEAHRLLDQLIVLFKEGKSALLEGHKLGTARMDLVYSPFIMTGNGALLNLGKTKIAMMAYSTVQTMVISDPEMVQSIENSFNNQLKHGKSLLNSSVADVEGFFDMLERQVDKTRRILTGEDTLGYGW